MIAALHGGEHGAGMMRLLVDAGADANKQTKDGWTAMMIAARDGTKHGAAMAFFKLGAFRIAWRTMWYLDRAEIMAAAGTWTDEDLCEHLLPLFMFVASQAMVESWPIQQSRRPSTLSKTLRTYTCLSQTGYGA